MRVLLTGSAGFVGFHTAKKLLEKGSTVLGIDNINDYYDPQFKHERLNILQKKPSFHFAKLDITDFKNLRDAWLGFKPDHVIHLAAQAGVRYSLEKPQLYIQANIVGFQNMMEMLRECMPVNFVYASSSSVYGSNKQKPYSESHMTSNPISLYAATKLANEHVAKAYGHLFKIPSTGLRFFTAYGPYGRPDMAIFKFAELMRGGQSIPVFNNGKMQRDFTYIDDIVDGVLRALAKPQMGEVYNLGRGEPVELMQVIQLLEKYTGYQAQMNMLPLQAGDVEATLADISKAGRDLGYQPKVTFSEGLNHFVKWYMSRFASTDIAA